jgi:hypothetical protein
MKTGGRPPVFYLGRRGYSHVCLQHGLLGDLPGRFALTEWAKWSNLFHKKPGI